MMCFPLSTHRVIYVYYFFANEDSVKNAFDDIYAKIIIEKLKSHSLKNGFR
jgi:hypothetical protein